ncbi:MAG: SRPBCC domain-containing protein [Nitrosospira sp.]
MATLYHQVWVNASTVKLYEAISTEKGIGSWWDKPRAAELAIGSVLEFSPGAEHGVLRMKVLERVQGKRVEWECISTHPKNSPASAWTGTHIIFEITERENMAILDFRHSGWDENSEYFGFCNYHWGVALQKLKQWCESQLTVTAQLTRCSSQGV